MAGTFIGLGAGGRYDFADPAASCYTPRDLAVNLSRICRYNGAVPFTVGQHLILGARLAQRRAPSLKHAVTLPIAYWWAHDAHEGCVCDVPAPMKPFLGAAYEKIERDAEVDVHRRLRLPFPRSPACEAFVTHIDRLTWVCEATALGQPVHADAALQRSGLAPPAKAELDAVHRVAAYRQEDVVAALLNAFANINAEWTGAT